MKKNWASLAVLGTVALASSLPAYATSHPQSAGQPLFAQSGDLNVAPLLQKPVELQTGQNAASGTQFDSTFMEVPPNMKAAMDKSRIWKDDAPLFTQEDMRQAKLSAAVSGMDPATAEFLKKLQEFMAQNREQARALGITIRAQIPTSMNRAPFATDGVDSIPVYAEDSLERTAPATELESQKLAEAEPARAVPTTLVGNPHLSSAL